MSPKKDETPEVPAETQTEPERQPREDIQEEKAPQGTLSLGDRVHNLEIGMADLRVLLERKIGLSRPLTPDEASAAAERTAEDREREEQIVAEKELRKYVKKMNNDPNKPDQPGGFRKGLSSQAIARAKELMKMLERKKPQWDFELIPDGS